MYTGCITFVQLGLYGLALIIRLMDTRNSPAGFKIPIPPTGDS